MEKNENEKDSLLCPQCGGVTERTEDGFYCPFCGFVEKRRQTASQEEEREYSKKLSSAREAGRIRALEEHANERSEAAKEQRLHKQRRLRARTIVIWTCILLLIIATIVMCAVDDLH